MSDQVTYDTMPDARHVHQDLNILSACVTADEALKRCYSTPTQATCHP